MCGRNVFEFFIFPTRLLHGTVKSGLGQLFDCLALVTYLNDRNYLGAPSLGSQSSPVGTVQSAGPRAPSLPSAA